MNTTDMMVANGYTMDPEYTYLKVPRCLLVFTRSEWVRAIKRGKYHKRQMSHKNRAKQDMSIASELKEKP